MFPSRQSWAASLLMVVALSPALHGCTDVGDTSATPGGDGGAGEPDATAIGQDATEDSMLGSDSAIDTGPGEDAGDDAAMGESSPPDTGTVEDTGVMDTGLREDTGVADTGAVESAAEDASVLDAGAEDAGPDATIADASADTGSADTGSADTGSADTGSGQDAGTGNLQTQCNAFLSANTTTLLNTSGATCTGTERTLFAKDPTGDCLTCAFTTGCLDDTQGDTGQECEDTGAAVDGITSGTTAQCITTLSCDLGLSPVNSPAPAAGLVVNAYCGDGTTTAVCETGTGPTGKCVSQITAGFPAGYTATQIVNSVAVRSDASGMANALLACLVTSDDPGCGKCLN
jgi:hypothetical protein